MVKVNPQRNRNIFFPTVSALSKQNLSQLIHQRFGHVYIAILKLMSKDRPMEGLLKNIPDLKEPLNIFLLTKATKSPTIDVSTPPPLGS